MDDQLKDIESEPYRVELEFFEGPLDLLLHLVKKHELDIFAIPVAFITEKYIEYLDLMRSMNLDVAGEFLVMAATLAHIKSREMLPPSDQDEDTEEEEEREDPKALLIRRLLEYQKYKDAAHNLGDMPQLGRGVWTRSQVLQEDDQPPPLEEVGLFALLEALSKVMGRATPKLTHDVMVDRISLATRISQMADLLRNRHQITFFECFKELILEKPSSEAALRMEIVVTFLAILEMARLRLLTVWQARGGEEIYLKVSDASIEIPSDLQQKDPYE